MHNLHDWRLIFAYHHKLVDLYVSIHQYSFKSSRCSKCYATKYIIVDYILARHPSIYRSSVIYIVEHGSTFTMFA